jgi:hypothetical protein
VVTGKWKYVAVDYDADEMYDLEADPYETSNLADSAGHADVKAQLRAKLIEQIEATQDPIGSHALLHKLRHDL